MPDKAVSDTFRPLSIEQIAAAFDVSVDEILDGWQTELMPRLQKALFLVAIQKQYEEWLRVWATNIIVMGGPFGRPRVI